MPSIRSSELEHIEAGKGNVWSDAILMLEDEDHRIRNRGVSTLLHRLSHKSRFQLLQTDEESYREGFGLLLDKVEDENYTVRMFAVTTLAVVLEATEGKDEFEDIYQKSLVEIFKAMEDNQPRVREHAIDIITERVRQAKQKRFS